MQLFAVTMNRHSTAVDALRAGGYRLTPQRVMVLSILAERPGHLGVEEIFREVHRLYPFVDVATVYRTLQLLKRLHLVLELDVGGHARYELVEADRHHHMVCRVCGRTIDFSPRYLDQFRKSLVAEFGFAPDLEHFAVAGTCADCARKPAAAPRPATANARPRGRSADSWTP
ncbi:MAG: transcriptional repressor [Chloroflexi bacterium]|nr:transcriptional repressor [Chloroflexota bacterium]